MPNRTRAGKCINAVSAAEQIKPIKPLFNYQKRRQYHNLAVLTPPVGIRNSVTIPEPHGFLIQNNMQGQTAETLTSPPCKLILAVII